LRFRRDEVEMRLREAEGRQEGRACGAEEKLEV
jgi:hypothetical protein